jgi:hypothetical protein
MGCGDVRREKEKKKTTMEQFGRMGERIMQILGLGIIQVNERLDRSVNRWIGVRCVGVVGRSVWVGSVINIYLRVYSSAVQSSVG